MGNMVKLQRVGEIQAADGFQVPGYLLEPEQPQGGLLLVHGYAGRKEEMLGLAVHVAEVGVAALCIDLRGHGDHPALLDQQVRNDVEAGLQYLRERGYGKVAVLGHSLGGRLALMSSADLIIGLSPAVAPQMAEGGKQVLTRLSSTKVRQAHPEVILELMRQLGEVPDRPAPKLLIIGARDVPGIVQGVRQLPGRLTQVEMTEVEEGQYPEVELTVGADYFPRWLNHAELKFNGRILEEIPRWLSGRMGGR